MGSAKLFTDRRFYLSVCYLLMALGFVVIGDDYFSEFSDHNDLIFWMITGILILPWSLIAGIIAIASFHTGSFFLAKFMLAIGAIINSLFILYWKRRGGN
jgi:hypothetical protein